MSRTTSGLSTLRRRSALARFRRARSRSNAARASLDFCSRSLTRRSRRRSLWSLTTAPGGKSGEDIRGVLIASLRPVGSPEFSRRCTSPPDVCHHCSMVRIAVVVNAGSGTGDARDAADRIVRAFAAHGVAPSLAVVPGGEVGDAARRALQEGASSVVGGGGDGTLSTVASVLAGTGTPLGILPLGTLNHFAKDLSIPLDVEAAVA